MKKLFKVFAPFYVLIGVVNSTYAQNFVYITKSDTGKIITLDTSQVLVITLPGNPSTGYSWFTSVLDINVISQIGDREFKSDSNKTKRVGQPGNFIFRFIAISKGTSRLTLEYKRKWEKDKKAYEVFTVNIVSAGKYTGNFRPPIKPVNTKK